MARSGPSLPQIDAAACSQGRLAASGCSACAAACPRGALQADAAGIGLDPGACSACGACAAACPQGAIALDGREAPQIEGRARGSVGLVCPARAAGVHTSGVLCLQALGLRALAGLWLQGVREISGLIGDCAACPDGKGLNLAGQLARLNALLASRDLPQMTLRKSAALPRNLPQLAPRAAGPDPRRRALLGGLSLTDARANPLARLNSLPGPAAPLMAFVPRIDPGRCTGCDACTRVCPEAALSLIKDENDEMLYRSHSNQCSGCGLCIDVCDSDALTIKTCQPEAPDLALSALHCAGCGVVVHVPVQGPWAAQSLCPVCARTGHHKRLHQVLE